MEAAVTTISPDRILKELADLWTHEGAESGSSVLRACTMTLVVVADEEASSIGETIAALMPEHPARAIHIRLIGGHGRTLSERVYQQCWMPFGQRRQVCCEQVEITAADEALGDLPSVVLPLAVADVPVILWCRATRLLGMPEFAQLTGIATKVIVDSAAMPDAPEALRRLAEANRGGAVADLAWTRLTRWREMLAQVFENRERLAQLAGVRRVMVEYGPGYETSARYLAAWIGEATGHAGTIAGMASETLALRVELTGGDLRVELARNDGTLTVTVNELSQCVRLSSPTDYLLLREELRIVRRDPVFERSLEVAAQ
jgi:glucose-6-phosphate dehydrogenase assembly protein OpcA